MVSSDRDDNKTNEIYVMNADGTGQTRLTDNTAYDWGPSWSPDGSRIAFYSVRVDGAHSDREIYVMNADGTGQTNLTNNDVYDSDPSWSPDGRQIAFVKGGKAGGIYVMNADGTEQTHLGEGNYPSWPP